MFCSCCFFVCSLLGFVADGRQKGLSRPIKTAPLVIIHSSLLCLDDHLKSYGHLALVLLFLVVMVVVVVCFLFLCVCYFGCFMGFKNA